MAQIVVYAYCNRTGKSGKNDANGLIEPTAIMGAMRSVAAGHSLTAMA
ncbi:hypothetical protein [Rhodoferax ferrireducens]|nr:hypothetical protein [Rhodoferax ferrireducens]